MKNQGTRLLVVEDHPDMQQSIKKGLSEHGYEVDLAADGEEAFYRINNWEYDAVVLDVMIPKLDGFDLLGRMREQGNYTPVLLLTALSDTNNVAKGLDLGADDYLVKPFDFRELLARVKAVIRRSTNRFETSINIGRDVIIDTEKQIASVNGESFRLTGQEFLLLTTLINKRGTILSRQSLYDRISDDAVDINSNLLDVLIYNLRKKLGKGVIITLRGQGYILGEE